MTVYFLILLESEHLPFYRLVESDIPGLLELPRTEDSHSDPIFIPNGLIFGDEIVTRAYVSCYIAHIYYYSPSNHIVSDEFPPKHHDKFIP